MSDKEEKGKTTPGQDAEIPLREIGTENNTEWQPPNNNSFESGAAGCGVGCLGGFLYLVFILYAISNTMRMDGKLGQWLFDFLALLGPVPLFLYSRKSKNRALFWGFLIPYFLLLLLFGTCTGQIR